MTRERPIIKKTNLVEKQHVFPRNQNKFRHINTSKSHHIYEEVPVSSSDGESSDGLDKPLGIIKINDRHIRESIENKQKLILRTNTLILYSSLSLTNTTTKS